MLPSRGGSESPERKEKGGSAFNSFSSRFGRGRDLPTPLEDEETSRPRSPLRTITSQSDRDDVPIDGSAQSLAAAGMLPNGNSGRADVRQTEASQLQEPLQPSAPDLIQPVSREPEAPKDNEGYSLPPPQLDAISQAQREANEGDGSSPAFNVNIRQAPIAEETSDADLTSMADRLKMVCSNCLLHDFLDTNRFAASTTSCFSPYWHPSGSSRHACQCIWSFSKYDTRASH